MMWSPNGNRLSRCWDISQRVLSYEDMTPQSFLRFIAEIRGFKGGTDDRVAAVAEELSIDHVLHQRIETLSKGFKRRVGWRRRFCTTLGC